MHYRNVFFNTFNLKWILFWEKNQTARLLQKCYIFLERTDMHSMSAPQVTMRHLSRKERYISRMQAYIATENWTILPKTTVPFPSTLVLPLTATHYQLYYNETKSHYIFGSQAYRRKITERILILRLNSMYLVLSCQQCIWAQVQISV